MANARTFSITSVRPLGAAPGGFVFTGCLGEDDFPIASCRGTFDEGRLEIADVVALHDVDAVICIHELILGLGLPCCDESTPVVNADPPSIVLGPAVVARLGLAFIEGVNFTSSSSAA